VSACCSYSREEPFTVLNIDIRNQQNLLESLEQYVKGDLLEGANAYHCEKCNKKASTVVLSLYYKQPLLAIILTFLWNGVFLLLNGP